MSRRAVTMSFRERAERQKRIAEVYASGLPSERVARMFGVSGHWVRAVARLYGVSRGNHGHRVERRDRRGRFA